MNKFKVVVLLFFMLAMWGYPTVFSNIRHLRLYWIVFATLDFSAWLIVFYPDYDWNLLNNTKRFVLSCVAIRFCLYFLPVDVLLQPLTQNILRWLGFVLILAVLVMNDKPRKV